MYLQKEFQEKKPTKSSRVFQNENNIPRFKNTGSFKTKKMLAIENLQSDIQKDLEDDEKRELLEDYKNNPYFRKKVDLIVENIMQKANQKKPKKLVDEDNELEVENLQTLNSKMRQNKKSQKVKF